MKYKVLGIVSLITVLAISVFALLVNYNKEEEERYHQHLYATEKEPCNHTDDTFCTHLPLVQIETNGQEIPGEPILAEDGHRIGYSTTKTGEGDLRCHITVVDNETKNNHINDTVTIDSDAMIRVRGNSSRYFSKLSYKVDLITEDGVNNPQEMMGMDAHHEWALHGPYLDKTLIRNYMWYNISGEIMEYAPNVRFCEVMINGEYMGLYLMTETITAGNNDARLNVSVTKKNSSFAGYVLRIDRGSNTELKNISPYSLYTYRNKEAKINIVYPGTQNLTPELSESIRQDFSDFERMLYTYDFDDPKYGYSTAIDVNSFANYFIINEFTCNYDAGSYSTYIYKAVDNKYYMCVWDFNNACDNYQEQPIDRETFHLHNTLWFQMIIKNKDFTKEVIEQYHNLRNSYLSDEYLENYIDETILYLGDAINRNNERWENVFLDDKDLLYPTERNLHSYDEAVEQMKDFIIQRGAWLDENMETISQYSADSKVKLYKEHTR